MKNIVKLIGIVSFILISCNRTVDIYQLKFNPEKQKIVFANFDAYLNTPLRQMLISSDNDGRFNLDSNDIGNWSYCGFGVGSLVGTYRDISACALTGYLGREATIDDLNNLDYNKASCVYEWIWNLCMGSKIPDQDVANLVMHIQCHYGNIAIVQRVINTFGYNIKVNGIMTNETIEALQKLTIENNICIYQSIRSRLEYRYLNGNPIYKKGFLRFLNEHFPNK